MRTTLLPLLVLLLPAAVAAPAGAAVKTLSAGAVVGEPTGGTVKLWFDDAFALDAGVGYSGDVVFWGDALWHDWRLLPQPSKGRLGLYLGAGPRLEAADDADFGLRALGGLSWRLDEHSLEFFVEAGPVFRLTRGGGVDADGGIGARLTFAPPGTR